MGFFINADPIFSVIALYRLCWLGGRFGGHKTSLAYRIAQNFLDDGYRLLTNTRCIWADDPKKVLLDDENHLKAVIVLDEGGLEFKSSNQIEQLAAYAAKMDCVYLIPSFFPPVRSAQVLTIQPVFNFKGAGIPLVIYKWRARLGAFDDKGWFGWYDPAEIYGIYSRQDPGARGAVLVETLIERKQQFRERYGHTDGLSEMEEAVSEIDKLSDAASAMAEAADTFAALPIRIRKRR